MSAILFVCFRALNLGTGIQVSVGPQPLGLRRGTSNDLELEKLKKCLRFLLYCTDYHYKSPASAPRRIACGARGGLLQLARIFTLKMDRVKMENDNMCQKSLVFLS
jgi:hypothetical protein